MKSRVTRVWERIKPIRLKQERKIFAFLDLSQSAGKSMGVNLVQNREKTQKRKEEGYVLLSV
jgi:hypothetical protein